MFFHLLLLTYNSLFGSILSIMKRRFGPDIW